ncbi:hypothetical protein Lalb_Chr23g0275731 [Lupinus albus]|uniref:Uncharacterized protein n=1 Tax=Lupinus albus TaxID=3870 RepID=A0A6A4NLS3_LUPAL|nr:hypothetical protein Lalb_Chr23g0275731 [Lupinus albus]
MQYLVINLLLFGQASQSPSSYAFSCFKEDEGNKRPIAGAPLICLTNFNCAS